MSAHDFHDTEAGLRMLRRIEAAGDGNGERSRLVSQS